MAKFINPFTDEGFKRLFGQEMVYASRCIDRQTIKGKEWNYDHLKAVFTISFLNYTQAGLPETLVVDGQMRDKYSGELVNPFLRLIYIQLPRLNKPLEQCTTPIEKWIYVLKNISNMVQIPPRLKESLEELQYFEDVMNEASMTPEERERYERSLDAYRQEMNSMSFYTRKGREEGRAEGREEGREEQNLANAKSMLQHGIDINMVHEITGISLEDLRRL